MSADTYERDDYEDPRDRWECASCGVVLGGRFPNVCGECLAEEQDGTSREAELGDE